MQRMGMVIGIKPEKIDDYKKLHLAVWPEILTQIQKSNIRKYSIFLREPENLLFGYMEYWGDDFAVDMAKMARDPKTQEWWALTDPCQDRFENLNANQQWAEMTEVFYMEQNND